MNSSAFIKDPPIARSYGNEFLVLDRGEGSYVFDVSGKRYLDFGSGIAVNALGHGNEKIARLAYEQMKKCVHVSNLYMTEPSISLAKKLVSFGPYSGVFFANSGTEANEAALKFARLYAHRTKGPGHHKFLCFTQAFHGRSMGALSCTPNKKYSDPFLPLIPGVEVLPFNDAKALLSVLDDSFCAVITEVVQGEGGLTSMTPHFAETLSGLCREKDCLLIADEVQTGFGRTGNLFAYESVGLVPDMVTLAKPLAGGLPLAAVLLPEKLQELLKPGDHGSTFGGGPVQSAVALEVINILSAPSFLEETKKKGDLLFKELSGLAEKCSIAEGVRGKGILLGISIKTEGETPPQIAEIITRAREKGLLILRSGDNVIRIAPPLIIKEQEIREGVAILEEILNSFA